MIAEGVFKALADPTRRKILRLLGQRDMTAGEISEHFALAKSTLSGHFGVLKAAGLVLDMKRGNTVVYSLNLSLLDELLVHLQELLGRGEKKTEGSEQSEICLAHRDS